MSGLDPHHACVYCLGYPHAFDAVYASERKGHCALCQMIKPRYLRRRLRRVEGQDDNEEEGVLQPQPSMSQATQPSTSTADADVAARQLGARPRDRSPARSWSDMADMEGPPPVIGPDENGEWPYDGEEYAVIDVAGCYDFDDEAYPEEDARSTGSVEGYLPSGQRPTTNPASANEVEGGSQSTSTTPKGDTPDLVQVFKKAVERCGLSWPTEVEQDVNETSVWEEMQPAHTEAQVKRLLPLAKGFKHALTLSWKNPGSFAWPRHVKPRRIECVEMAELALEGMPPPDRRVAAHLSSSAPGLKRPRFVDRRDREASALNNKLYDTQASIAGALNAMAILQGATTALLNAEGALDTERSAELRRLHHETMMLTKSVTEQVGRSMALGVVLERSQWVTLSSVSEDKKERILDLPIVPEGLLTGAMALMTESHAIDKQECEALRACLPTIRGKKPLPQAGRGAWIPSKRGAGTGGYRPPPPQSQGDPTAAKGRGGPQPPSHTGQGGQQSYRPGRGGRGHGRGGGRGGRGRAK